MAEFVFDRFDDVPLVVVDGFFDHLLIAGEVVVIDQVFGSGRGVPGAIGIGVDLVHGTDADAAGVVVVGRPLDPRLIASGEVGIVAMTDNAPLEL